MAGTVESKVYRGIDGLRDYYEELFESFSEVRLQNREYRDLDDRPGSRSLPTSHPRQ